LEDKKNPKNSFNIDLNGNWRSRI